MTSKWRLAARRAIQSAIASLPPDASKKEIKKAIDQAYPFGFRELYPYKVWLSERREYFYQLGISNKPDKRGKSSRKPGVKKDIVPPGQLSLW